MGNTFGAPLELQMESMYRVLAITNSAAPNDCTGDLISYTLGDCFEDPGGSGYYYKPAGSCSPWTMEIEIHMDSSCSNKLAAQPIPEQQPDACNDQDGIGSSLYSCCTV